MNAPGCRRRPGRIFLLLLALCVAAGTLGPLEAQGGRRSTGYTRRPTSAEIIARRKAEREARDSRLRARTAGRRAPAAVGVAAVEEDLRRMASAGGWAARMPESRIRRLAPLIVSAADHYRLPPALVMAIIHLESQYVPDARSRVGATGLMQVMPGWLGTLGSRFGTDLSDEGTNLRYGTWVLQDALAKAGGDLDRALLIYNGCRPEGGRSPCSTYPDRVRQRVEAHTRTTCGSRGWQACVVEPLRRAYGGR